MSLTPDAAWQELCEKDDRTSPAEYPEMCLISRDELFDFIARASIQWPDTGSLVMPRNEAKAEPDPVLDVLAEFAAFWNLIRIAYALRAGGMPIPTRAEAEYAAAAHWLVGHALRSGTEWREAAIADMKARQASASEVAS